MKAMPDGFEPVYTYPDGSEEKKIPREGEAALKIKGVRGGGLRFVVRNGYPKLPLKLVSDLWFKGWEIPMTYVVDGDNQLWADQTAHGFGLCKITPEELLKEANDLENKAQVLSVFKQFKIKVPGVDYWPVLHAFDPKYFRDKKKYTFKKAAYYLATWIFDHPPEDPALRKKMKKGLPHDLYVAALECYYDGDHDT